MTERQLQFRVGMFVVIAAVVAAGLTFRFGEMRGLWDKTYPVFISFDAAPGVERGTPVRKNGVSIGNVREVLFEEERGGITVVVNIRERFPLRKDSQPRLTQSLLGDATIEFTPGKSREVHKPGARIKGDSATDPIQLAARVESQLNQTLTSFAETSNEWRKVGKNMNELTETHRGNLGVVIEQAAESLHQFTIATQSANKMLGDPQTQENLRSTMAALPEMLEDTKKTIRAIRVAVTKMDATLTNLHEVTEPLAKRSDSIVTKLDKSVGNLEMLSAELNLFTRNMNNEQGSLKLLVSDPKLYRNLNQSAEALETILKNLDPVIRDMRIFSDKVARHPELIGVGGAFKSSSGLK